MADTNRNIKYINRDFSSLRQQLIDFSKTYFPTTYKDFSPSAPGTMFMEMSAYVGDVLSYYLDTQVQETFIEYAKQEENIYSLAYMLGYRPKVTGASTVELSFYQQVPVTANGQPDYDYTLRILPNSIVDSASTTNQFIIEDDIDFSFSSSNDPTNVTIYQYDANGNPEYYLLEKKRKAVSSTIKTQTFSLGEDPVSFNTIYLDDRNIIGILDITDEDGNVWYEVPYLGQEMIFDKIKNTNPNDPNYSSDEDALYLLRLKKTPKRFATRFVNTGSLAIQFGSGTTNDIDEEIVPNSDNIGLGLPFEKTKLTTAFDPSNFLRTDTYGIAPTGELTVRYLTGGGVASNVVSNDINSVSTTDSTIIFNNNNVNSPSTANYIFTTLAVNNLDPATGGRNGDSLEEIKQNSLKSFAAQQRTITAEDYTVRALSMPSDYGIISKLDVRQSDASESTINTLQMYVLGENNEGQFTTLSDAVKNNLRTYLNQYKIIGDNVEIKDAFIVNIGIQFEIIVLPNYNNNQVILDCINELKNYFNNPNQQINQPIILREIYILLDKVKGVQTVKTIDITNLSDTSLGYSQYAYDMEGATINNVIYPSIDSMIFEVKYPDQDIKGRVVPL